MVTFETAHRQLEEIKRLVLEIGIEKAKLQNENARLRAELSAAREVIKAVHEGVYCAEIAAEWLERADAE